MRYFLAICALLTLSGQALAQPQAAVGIFCDKRDEIAQLFEHVYRRGETLEKALAVINGEVVPPKCVVGQVVLDEPVLVERLTHQTDVFGLFQVKILAFRSETGIVTLPEPMVQYGMKPLPKEAAL